MTVIRILGVGSPHGDDRAGWEVIEALRASGLLAQPAADAITAECVDRPGSRLIPRLAGADVVVVVDAMRGGSPPGTVRKLALEETESAPETFSCHGFGPGAALALARALGALPSRLAVFGIELGQLTPGEGLSAPVQASIPEAVRRVIEELKAYREADDRASARRDAPNRAMP